MRIGRRLVSSAGMAPRATGRAGSEGGVFALPEAASAGVSQAEAPEAAMAALPVYAACIEGAASDQAGSDKAAAGQAGAVLQGLRALQLAMLGPGGEGARQALAGLACPAQASDPRLDAVLKAIAQRAAIELARPV